MSKSVKEEKPPLAYRLGAVWGLIKFGRDTICEEHNTGRIESYIVAIVTGLTMTVVYETITDAIESFRLDKERHMRKYWWFYYEVQEPQYDVQPPEQPEQQDVWPPFTGVRKELGSDIV